MAGRLRRQSPRYWQRGLYWLAVPVLVMGTVGLLWPYRCRRLSSSEFLHSLNWGSTFLMATVVYYFIISVSLAIGMLPFMLGVAAVASCFTCQHFRLYWSRPVSQAAQSSDYGSGGTRTVGIRAVVQDIHVDDDCAGVVTVSPLSAIGNTVLNNSVRIGGPIWQIETSRNPYGQHQAS